MERATREVDNLVVFFTEQGAKGKSFKMFDDLAHDLLQQDDVRFVWFDTKGLNEEVRSHLKTEEGLVRVYQYRATRHFKERVCPEKYEELRTFVLRSVFTGPAPGIARELSTENAMRIF